MTNGSEQFPAVLGNGSPNGSRFPLLGEPEPELFMDRTYWTSGSQQAHSKRRDAAPAREGEPVDDTRSS
jgi:hypothetical protein